MAACGCDRSDTPFRRDVGGRPRDSVDGLDISKTREWTPNPLESIETCRTARQGQLGPTGFAARQEALS